ETSDRARAGCGRRHRRRRWRAWNALRSAEGLGSTFPLRIEPGHRDRDAGPQAPASGGKEDATDRVPGDARNLSFWLREGIRVLGLRDRVRWRRACKRL